MKIEIQCRRCQRCLHGDIPLGGSPAELVRSFAWTYSPESTGFLCSSCLGGEIQSSIGRRQTISRVSAPGVR